MNQFEHISDEILHGKIGVYEGKKVKIFYKISDSLAVVMMQSGKYNGEVEYVPSQEVELLGIRKGQIKK